MSFEDEHELFRDSVRSFVEKEMVPHPERRDRAGIMDREIFHSAGAAGFLGTDVPETYGRGGVSDFRYNLIVGEELQRAHLGGAGLGITLHKPGW